MTTQDLGRILRGFTLKYPFFGHLLIRLRKDIVSGKEHPVQTAAVSIDKETMNINLTVNSDFFDTLTPQQKEGVLHHEILHVAFRHLELADSFSDKKVANVAMDMEINQLIDKASLPPGLIEYDGGPYAKLNLPPNKGTKFYYTALMEEVRNNNKEIQQAIEEDGSSHKWESIEGMGSTKKKLFKQQQDHTLKEAVNDTGGPKNMGSMSADLRRMLDKLFEKTPSVFNWKAFFRRYTGTIIDIQRKKTLKRLSKRFEGSPGLRTKRKQNVFVSVDVSGSMSTKEISEVFHQLDFIYKAGANIEVVTWDSKIQERFTYSGKPPEKVSGGGGSDIGLPIREYNKKKKDYTFAVHLTDGYVNNTEKLYGKHLFIITSKGSKFDASNGGRLGKYTMIQIPEENEKAN